VPVAAAPPSPHAALRDDGLRLLADALDGFIYDWEIATGRVTRSAGLAELLGYAPDEVAPTAEWWHEHLHPDDAAARVAAGRAALDDPATAVLVTEYRMRHRDGRYLWVRDRARLVRDPAGALVRVVGITTDLSVERRAADERRAREEELRASSAAAERARAEAVAANRAKSEFLAVMSHELRTPLNAIQGHLQLIDMELHGPVTPGQRDALQRVDRAQRHLLSLINEVLNFAKLDAGAVAFDVAPVHVGEVLADVVPLVEPQLADKSIAFVVEPLDVAARPPLPVLADRDKLGQVLLNLLVNAAKFTPSGGEVRLTLDDHPADEAPRAHAGVAAGMPAEARPRRVAIHVHDTGIGIPADRLTDVFEPFVQVDSSLRREAAGTGLGLAISRDLARGMGGEVTVRSTLGAGSTFTVWLRVA
jgi:PAS domain S-box-containing protein